MRKILVMLLVVGLLLGTFIATEDMKEVSGGEEKGYNMNHFNTTDDPIPCGGEGGGSGGGQPG